MKRVIGYLEHKIFMAKCDIRVSKEELLENFDSELQEHVADRQEEVIECEKAIAILKKASEVSE